MNNEKLKAFLSRYGHILWVIFLGFLFVTLCSKCSFVYPFNDWVDSNVYFTIGKAMVRGKVLYRDIFDHKGPYIYMLHSLAYLISHRSFIGVYLMEIPLAALFGYSVYRLILLYAEKKYALLLVPVVMFASYASIAFCHGDSAEELVMPFMALSLLHLMQFMKGQKLAWWKYALAGLFSAIAFWIKFTLCGFFFGWILLVFIFDVKDKNVKHALACAGIFIGAFLLATLPVIIYFAANHSFGDLFEVYFVDNLFVYSGGSEGAAVKFFKKAGMTLWNFIRSFGYGLFFYLLAVPGFIYFAWSKEICRREKIALFVTYALVNFFIYIGGKGGKYYGLPVCIFAFAGAVAFCNVKFTSRLRDKISKHALPVTASAVAVLAVISPFVSPFRVEMLKSRSELVQYQFAEIIAEKEDATLLNYGVLDLGLYTVTDIVPVNKYFFKPNISLPEIMEEQDWIITEGKVDFVILLNDPPEIINLNYELVAKRRQRNETHLQTYYLYALKESNDETSNLHSSAVL